jgi:hypothetical protein
MCARVGNQQSRGVVTAWVRIDAVRSLHHQRRDFHQSTYPHTHVYDVNLLKKGEMDVELSTLFRAVGWNFVMRFLGSPLLVEVI